MIRQVSVFVENKPGSLMDVTSRLTEAGVNIRAVATFDTPEFGILRMVVDKPDEAKEYLTKLGYVVRIHEVMGVALEDKKGNLNQMLAIVFGGTVFSITSYQSSLEKSMCCAAIPSTIKLNTLGLPSFLDSSVASTA